MVVMNAVDDVRGGEHPDSRDRPAFEKVFQILRHRDNTILKRLQSYKVTRLQGATNITRAQLAPL